MMDRQAVQGPSDNWRSEGRVAGGQRRWERWELNPDFYAALQVISPKVASSWVIRSSVCFGEAL